ncbi:stromal-processing peptidase, putative [Hepatocystis sp. ex Piliocolobus tephrosceles]|nr:stromal-processing peptidase, putative [Hepatocystis sp. ex Piliocolobus tephrosceles]
MIKVNGIVLFYFILNLVYCLNNVFRKNAYILYSPKLIKSSKPASRRWSTSQNNDMCDLLEDDDLIKCQLPNKLSSIIYKKRKNRNKKMHILNNEKHIILPSHKISNEYKKNIDHINYNYEELHVYMEINTGSVNEKKNQQGISHLCEHVSYMGSKNRKNILDKNIRTNAYTDFHHIVFYISVSMNNEIYKDYMLNDFKCDNKVENIKEENIEDYDIYTLDEFNYKHDILSKCIDTMVEVLKGDTQFTKERITKEKKAIFSEYSIINTVEYKINSDIIKTLHRENRLSHRLPIGKLELLKRYEEKDVKEYFDLFFRPENANIYVYGDVNTDITQSLINNKFKNIIKKKLTKDDQIYMDILTENTLRSTNKNLPAVVHKFSDNLLDKTANICNNGSNITSEMEIKESNCFNTDQNKSNESANLVNLIQPTFLHDPPEPPCEYIDDNIVDSEKFKELTKNPDPIINELKFRSYLEKKYAVNLEEEKSLNKSNIKNNETLFEIFNYALNNVTINILAKEKIKGIKTMQDLKISIIKDIIFYCLSFRFNIQRQHLFNNIDINEYTNINEGATIKTIEIKTNVQTFDKTIQMFYNFIKSLMQYGFSNDELENYKINKMYDDLCEDSYTDVVETGSTSGSDTTTTTTTTTTTATTTTTTTNTTITPHSGKNSKLIHPEKEDEFIQDNKINETYADEIQKIIDYNSCKHIYMNEKREKIIRKQIFNNLTIEEINLFAKNYFKYLFNVFTQNTNFKPNCIIVHVPNESSHLFDKQKIKKLFYNNIYSTEHVPDYSFSIQNKLLSDNYIFENITKNVNQSKYINNKNRSANLNNSKTIFDYIFHKLENIKNNNTLTQLSYGRDSSTTEGYSPYSDNNILCSIHDLNTIPNFNFFQNCYNINNIQLKNELGDHTEHITDRTELYSLKRGEQNEKYLKLKKKKKDINGYDRLYTDTERSSNMDKELTNTFTDAPHNTFTDVPHNTFTDVPHNTFTDVPHNTFTDVPHNTFTDVPHNTFTDVPHNTFTDAPYYTSPTQQQIQNFELLNGIKINIYKTQIDKHNMYIKLIIPHNDILKNKKDKTFLLLFSIICLFEGGEIENIDREKVEIHCSNKNINIMIDVNDEYFYIDIYTYNKYENMHSAFSILNNIIVQTKIEPSALHRVVDKLKKDYYEYRNNLQSFLIGQTLSYISDNKLGYQNFDLQLLEKITIEDVNIVLNNLFNDLSLFEVTIVGDVTDFIHYYIRHYLGTITKNKEEKKITNFDILNNQKEVTNVVKKSNMMNNEIVESYNSSSTKTVTNEKINDITYEYNLLCPLVKLEQKSKQTTYVYLNDKEEHAVFLLMGKSANNFGFLPNGVHISIYLLQFLKKIEYLINNNNNNNNNSNNNNSNNSNDRQQISDKEKNMIDIELEKIKSYIDINDFSKTQFDEFMEKKKKLYTNPIFFSAVSYIIQYILNSKFFHYLREKKDLTYDSSFEFLNYEKYFAGVFMLLVQTNPKDLELIKKEVLSSINEFTKNYFYYSDYLIENAKLSYLNKKNKDLKYIIDKICGMQILHFPLKYKNKNLLKDNLILNQIQKVDILLVLFILFGQTENYHISYGISASEDTWHHLYTNINQL